MIFEPSFTRLTVVISSAETHKKGGIPRTRAPTSLASTPHPRPLLSSSPEKGTAMEDEGEIPGASSQRPPQIATLHRPLRCIVKLGGAAVTCKHEIEQIDEENLGPVCSQLRQAMGAGASSAEALGMDWSRRPGIAGIPSVVEFDERAVLNLESVIVVHGAGSFGHFQASRSGVHKGGLDMPIVKAGFVATRISVTSLNLEIVRALAREGIPAVGMPPFPCGWSTCNRNVASAEVSPVTDALNAGFVPVLHGDAVLDNVQGCTILSGDVIIRHLAQQLRPEYVVFLTDVLGVYDRPPTDPDAVLLREIAVQEDGSWSVVKPVIQQMKKEVEITVAAHDTTGGMETKISEAATIARLGINVFITKVGTSHSLRALKGELVNECIDDWLGTAIRPARWAFSIRVAYVLQKPLNLNRAGKSLTVAATANL
ncbi:hypothetical protein Taro_019943 [Colocasia esculenta]|uniref:Isopentenyl phosphate kinase n=1 Tax=Colocasia esculenta TaxID=4460 RepID=A0A843V717_COLES|nr:hypothetical protein [Colocasia esculenta]